MGRGHGMAPLDQRTDGCLKDSLPGAVGSNSTPFICVCGRDEIVSLGEGQALGQALQQAAGRSAEAYRQGGHSVPAGLWQPCCLLSILMGQDFS